MELKKITKQVSLLLCLVACGMLPFTVMAQSVSFTNQTNLIPDVGGGFGSDGGYEDCAVDMDGDYLDDIVRVDGDGLYIDYQQADGTFEHKMFPMDFETLPSWSLAAGDIDGNGFMDLLFGGGENVSFIKANDDGTAYTEYMEDEYIFSQRSTFADIDNDGDLDAFVCHDVDQSLPFRNDGAGNMTVDQTLIETADLAGNYAALWVDYDNDWDTDLYITKCKQGSLAGDIERTNLLYRNNGNGTYTEVGMEANMDDNAQSWATVFEDFDNDGDFDAFIVNHDEANRFMLNNGDGTFTDIIESTGIDPYDLGAWENAAADFNNDGFVDILSELGNELYINNGDMTFTPQQLSFRDGGIGDFNNDGFLDVVNDNDVWINNGNENNWVKINTRGIISNRGGIGARVEAYGSWGMQIREVRSGQSFSPMSSTCIHFGLGTAEAIDQIVIKWPSGMETVIENPAINTTHNMIEVDCLLSPSTIAASGETSICPGNSVELSVPGTYDNYVWSNGATTPSITVTEGGTYSAVLSNEDGCTSLAENITITVIEDAAPIVSASGVLSFCQGESVTLTSTEGANPVWSNGETGLSLDITESGNYFISIDAQCLSAPLVSEVITVEALSAELPITEVPVLTEAGTILFSATGNNLTWYDAEEGGNIVGEGESFDAGEIAGDETFYVSSSLIIPGEIQAGGKTDATGGGGLPSTGAYSYFDAFEPFTVRYVTVYVPSEEEEGEEGERTFRLRDSDDNVLAETSMYLEEGEHRIELNFEVPEGEDFYIECAENNLFRNDSGVNYPYPIGEVGELTTSPYGGGYYYYFYNWEIQKPPVECESDLVAINASSVGIEDIKNAIDFKLYPNPTSNEVTLSFTVTSTPNAQLHIYDVLGKLVFQNELSQLQAGENQAQVNVSRFAKGMYNVQLTVGNAVYSQKLLVD